MADEVTPSSVEIDSASTPAESLPAPTIQPESALPTNPEPVEAPVDIAVVPTAPPTPPPVAPSTGPYVVQMTYEMLRDLAARARAGVQLRKRKKFERILAHVAEHGKITNHEAAHFLYVSHDTASRYLAQLTKEGQLKRIGHTGHAVYYTRP